MADAHQDRVAACLHASSHQTYCLLSCILQVVTDVGGSTQLWEWNPAVMGAAVEQHNVILRGLLEQHGGHEVRTDGDSFTLAFHDAADAVAYCIQVLWVVAGVCGLHCTALSCPFI
eukprot:GHRR01037223.1.p1 GENE.GHRR01037223.1~~GHRR01037223.1.p1  ORF type:complete len:116 (+),score=22.79 GHRR01037223.1:561-908(+)